MDNNFTQKKLPTILGVVILVIGVAVGVVVVQEGTVFRIGASASQTPQNIGISNTTSSSFTVSWTTEEDSIGFLKWGTEELDESAHEQTIVDGTVHSVTIRELTPSTTYSFVIVSGGDEFTNNMAPWTVTLGPELSSPTNTNLLAGTVAKVSGGPAAGVIVKAASSGVHSLSSVTTSEGQWVIPLSNARTGDLSAYATFNPSSRFDIVVLGGIDGASGAIVTLETGNPTPEIILGQNYDFTKEVPLKSGALPQSNVDLPQVDSSSQFNISQVRGVNDTANTEPVTVNSIREGEIIFTNTPEFFGEGPASTTITVTVESNHPVTQQISVGNDGRWNWSPPSTLEVGKHTLTLAWKDANGILRRVTKSFTVLAQEGPAFESTPSGTPFTPFPTPTQTSAPTPPPTVAPSIPPTSASPSATPTTLPDSGVGLYTNIAAIFGIFLIISGAYGVYKIS